MATKHLVCKAFGIFGVLVILTGAAASVLAQEARDQEVMPLTELPAVKVIGVTPLHGVGLAKDKFPAHVQDASSEEIRDSNTPGIGDFMSENMVGVWINEAQNNPLQPNINYRGYSVSPLLGLPQGLAVYQDGVRINEPFGDTVNMDLIPMSAISSMQLIPGSSPEFGRNALGGAILIETKTGLTDPGTAGEVYYGSFDRHYYQVQHGGSKGVFNYFVTGEYFSEDGWRDISPSRAKRLYGNIGYDEGGSRLNLSLTTAKTDLIGNGTSPVQLLEYDRAAIYTAPDATMSDLLMLNLDGEQKLADTITLSGNTYFRSNTIDTLNGDDADFDTCSDGVTLCYDDTNDPVYDKSTGNPIPRRVFGGQKIDGTNNITKTKQHGYGGNLQLTFKNELPIGENQLTIGGAVDASHINYRAQTWLSVLDFNRAVIESDYIDSESVTRVTVNTRDYGLYLTDTWSVTPDLDITFAGRYNKSKIRLDDRIDGAASGNHTYRRFNPAVGAVYHFMPEFSLYGRYSESSRAATPIELSCANPDAPCRLPNDMVDDPPLDQVVAKNWEIGGRGLVTGNSWGNAWLAHWNLALFRSINHDDIQFISTSTLTSNEGFFRNVGKTRNRGVELALNGRYANLEWFLNYTFLDSEFRHPFTAQSPQHPYADSNGLIQVERGDRIPVTPRNIFKMGVDYAFTPKFSLGASMFYTSDRVLRMDESNQLDTISGYTLVNLRGEYRVNDNWTLFGRLTNLFDKEYATFGGLGEPDEVLGDDFDNPRMLGPGEPRAAWFGVRANF